MNCEKWNCLSRKKSTLIRAITAAHCENPIGNKATHRIGVLRNPYDKAFKNGSV